MTYIIKRIEKILITGGETIFYVGTETSDNIQQTSDIKFVVRKNEAKNFSTEEEANNIINDINTVYNGIVDANLTIEEIN